MPAPTVKVGDVVRWRGSVHVISHLQSGGAVLCPVLSMRTVRHRADIVVAFPDTLYLGVVDGALIRCNPFVFRDAHKLAVDGSLSAELLGRIHHAIDREMNVRRVEAGLPEYRVR